ncbi:acyltransferase domain-containing protein [Paraburkholderia humisilvae]|nr:acyltransferase domain-containing protein [Paraburkholderia humisilvae]
MFSGQGSQYFQMGRQLHDAHPVFRHWMTRLDVLAQRLAGVSVVNAMFAGKPADPFDRTLHTHPAIFIVEYALAQCLISEGIEPDLTLGASLGSFAAAVCAGSLAVEDALAAVIEQARSFEASCERGGMIAVLEDRALHDDGPLTGLGELAADNFSGHFALAAPQARLPDIEAALRVREISYQRLAVSFAYHSRWIESAQPHFNAVMRSIPTRTPTLPVICCAQAKQLDVLPDGFFWQVVREPIRLRDTITGLERSGASRFIDVGPSGSMATFVKYALPASSASTFHAVLTPYRRDLDNLAALRSLTT